MAASPVPCTLRSLLLSVLLLVGATAGAQVDNIYVYGTVKDYNTAKKMDGVNVTVFKNGSKLNEVVTSANGKYEFNLDYGNQYKLLFSKTGIVSKNVTIDTRSIPEAQRQGGLAMNVEMTLFQELPGVDFKMLDQPIGKSRYDSTKQMLSWDLAYTEQIRSAMEKMLKAYDDKKKNEANADEDYKKLMDQGTAAMSSADYKKAVESFTGALGIKAGDAIATAKLSDAQMKLNEANANKKQDEQYAALIKAADGLFGKKQYADAKAKYTAAAGVKDQEAYPKQQIKQCDAFIADLAAKAAADKKAKELDAKYQAAVTAGDAAFKSAKYDDAKAQYNTATGLKPDEKYPKDQLAAIDKKLADLATQAAADKKAKELDAKYQAAITAGDAAFKGAKYDGAKTQYNIALGLKPDEKYPKEQLAAIDKKLAELADQAAADKKAKALDAQYQAAITAADAAFKSANYDEAKVQYTTASGLKPDEKYPKDQLAAIDKKLADLAAQADADQKAKAIDAQYQAAITAADAAFKGANYDEAKKQYNSASGLKPDEQYPKDQLAAIDKKLADLASQADADKKAKELDAKFQDLVGKAEKLFTAEKYEDSKAKFQEALTVKPDEPGPKERIAEIDAKLAELAKSAADQQKQEALNAQYKALIASADKKFGKEDNSGALADYQDASALKPDEQYPKDQIAAIGKLMDAAASAKAEKDRLAREAKQNEQQFDDLVAQADKDFTAKNYDAAKTGYTSALALKPDEKQPAKRIAEIEGILAAQAKADSLEAAKQNASAAARTRYNAAIAKGDFAFNGKDYGAARSAYTEAQNILPDEQYPKDRLATIDQALAALSKAKQDSAQMADEGRQRREAQQALDEQYAKVIADADKSMAAQDYAGARGLYTQALDIKPKEPYPPVKIAQIDKLLADREQHRLDSLRAAMKTPDPAPVAAPTASAADTRKEQEAEEFMREAREREEAEKYDRIKRQIDTVESNSLKYQEGAAGRQAGYTHRNNAYADGSAKLYQGSQAMWERNVQAIDSLRAAVAERRRQRVAREAKERAAAVAGKAALVEQMGQEVSGWRGKSTAKAEKEAQLQNDRAAKRSEVAQAGAQRTDAAMAQVKDAERRNQEITGHGRASEDRRSGEVARMKQQVADRRKMVRSAQANRAGNAMEQLRKTPMGHDRSSTEYSRNELASKYPQGVTEESYTQGNKVIIRRVVVKGNKADEYSKVIAKWGTFYFRNGYSITEHTWSLNTEP